MLFLLGLALAAPAHAEEPKAAAAAAAAPKDSVTDTGPRKGDIAPVARLLHERLIECSGIDFLDGAFWAHNDSGDDAVLYRSATLDFANAEVLPLPGANAFDWEDITTIDGDLYACDVGDNNRVRGSRLRPCREGGPPVSDEITVYRAKYVPATTAAPARMELVAAYPLAYPDGRHDCEAAFVLDGKLHLVIKNRGERGTGVYRFDTLKPRSAFDATKRARFDELALEYDRTLPLPAPPKEAPETRAARDQKGAEIAAELERLRPDVANVAAKVGTLALLPGVMVTGGDVDSQSGAVVLLSYTQLLRYPARRLDGEPAARTLIRALQCEAVCFHDRRLVFTNEQREVYAVDDFLARDYEVLLRSAMKLALPRAENAPSDDAWPKESAALPLRGLLPGEELRWLLVGNRLHVRGRFLHRGEIDVATSRNVGGTGLQLAFSPHALPYSSPDEFHLYVGAAGTDRVGVWKLDPLSRSAPQVVESISARGTLTDDAFAFAVDVPLGLVFGGPVSQRFHVDVVGGNRLRRKGEAPVELCGVLGHPAGYAEVTLAR